MGIYKRENGIYYIKIRENKQYKRLSLETKDRNLAQEIYNAYLLDKLKLKLCKNNHTNQAHQNVSIQNSIEIEESRQLISPIYQKYINHCQVQHISQNTITGKLNLLKIFKKHKIFYIDELTQENFNRLLKAWKNYKQDSIRKHIANIKAFLNYCIKQKVYKRDDYEGLTFPSIKVGIREIVISDNDYEKLIENIKDDDFSLYLKTLYETGTRPNEITQLKKSNIDFDKGLAKVYQSKTKKFKTVYFTDSLLKEFEKIETERMFLGYDRQKEYYSKKFSKLRDSLNMNKEYCLYTFRHTFGTRMMNKTKDIHLVSKLLGHSDISITAKHYINRSDKEIREKLIN